MAVTIRDIAKRSGVSLTTVSRVLNDSGYVKDETREKVLKTMKEMNYVPNAIARSLSRNKTNTIGVVVPDINNPFFGEVIKGVTSEIDKEELNMILFDTDESIKKEIKALKLLKEQRIEGVIMTPTSNDTDYNIEYLNLLDNLGIPIVLVAGDVKYSNFNGVFADDVKGGYEATEAFIKEGHEKIAIITGRINTSSAKDRLVGYKKALLSYDIPIREEYIFYGDYRQESGYEITKEILKMKDRPSAVFISNNMMTLGFMKAVNEEKLSIPQDIAVIGYDEIKVLNILGMNISFICEPANEMGTSAAKILIENMKNKKGKVAKRVTLSPELLLKGSEKLIK